jgi:hypothetical protein
MGERFRLVSIYTKKSILVQSMTDSRNKKDSEKLFLKSETILIRRYGSDHSLFLIHRICGMLPYTF